MDPRAEICGSELSSKAAVLGGGLVTQNKELGSILRTNLRYTVIIGTSWLRKVKHERD